MTSYPALLGELQDAILSGDTRHAALAYRDKRDFPATQQLSVYADGYRIRLCKTVEADFPALLFYLGEARLRPLIGQFVETTPSRYWNLDRYPLSFADFIAAHASDPFATELARLENAIAEVYLGPESEPLSAHSLAAQAEDLAALRLLPRRASALLANDFPVNDYLSRFRAGEAPQPPAAQPCYLAVYRHNNEVKRLEMEREEFLLLQSLAGGKALGEALEEDSLFDPAALETIVPKLSLWFQRWVENGVLRQPEA